MIYHQKHTTHHTLHVPQRFLSIFVQHFIFVFIFSHCITFLLILTMKVYVHSFLNLECFVNTYSLNTFLTPCAIFSLMISTRFAHLFIFVFFLYTSPSHFHYEGLSSFCCHALVHSDQILTGDTLNHTNSLLRNDSSPFRANVHD